MTARRIRQPGPAQMPRVVAVDCRVRDIRFTLPAGIRLLDGVAAALAAAGCSSAAVELTGGAFGPFTYVIPALSTTTDHAAFYSDFLRPEGPTPLLSARMTFGSKDGEPWFHCHGFWLVDGVRTGGHIIPADTVVAEPIDAQAWGVSGAAFSAEPDPETRFQLFGPVAVPEPGGSEGREAVAVRIRPHEDVCATFETLCRDRGWTHARICGGVASTIGARFEDGTSVDHFATEVFVVDGRVTPSPEGEPVATIDVGLIDFTGALAEGRYVRGDNPVLMTFEAVLMRCTPTEVVRMP